MPVEKERVSVTLTTPYLKFLEHVVKDGTYLRPGEALRAGLRLLMKEHDFRITPEETAG